MTKKKPAPRGRRQKPPATGDAKPAVVVDPYKVWMVGVTLAPAFATEFFNDTHNLNNLWTDYDDMADTLLRMATAIAKRV